MSIESDMRNGFKDAADAVSRIHGRMDKILWGTLVGICGVLAQIVLHFFGK